MDFPTSSQGSPRGGQGVWEGLSMLPEYSFHLHQVATPPLLPQPSELSFISSKD